MANRSTQDHLRIRNATKKGNEVHQCQSKQFLKLCIPSETATEIATGHFDTQIRRQANKYAVKLVVENPTFEACYGRWELTTSKRISRSQSYPFASFSE